MFTNCKGGYGRESRRKVWSEKRSKVSQGQMHPFSIIPFQCSVLVKFTVLVNFTESFWDVEAGKDRKNVTFLISIIVIHIHYK